MSTFVRIRKTLWRTLLQAVPTVLGIVILVFLLLQLVPGDAADCGLSVVVADENPQAGGQIYRQLSGNPLLQRLAASGIDDLPRTSVWQIAGDNTAYFSGTRPGVVKARFIVLAAGVSWQTECDEWF